MREFFDSLTGDATTALNIWVLIVLVFVVDFVTTVTQMAYEALAPLFANLARALVRVNLFTAILAGQPIRSGPSTGDTTNRFNHDVRELVVPIGRDKATATAGFLVAIPFALFVMVKISPVMTAVALVPMVAVAGLTRTLEGRIRRYREASRETTGRVTGNLWELLSAVQAVQVAGTEARAVDHFGQLGDARRRTLVKENVFESVLGSTFETVVNLTTGAVLIAAAGLMRSGDLTVGDLALFLTYIRSDVLSYFPIWIGRMLADVKRSGVSMKRLGELLSNKATGRLARRRPLYLRGTLPDVSVVRKSEYDRLVSVDATGLTYVHPGSGRGIHGVDLRLTRGSITVITGRAGAGKTTLLEALLGVVTISRGEIRWNGRVVEDPGSFLIPPRSAYASQAPHLSSQSLRDNILMGLPEDRVDIVRAIHSAVLEQDIDGLEHGLDTIVGPRGVKLSGGQVQRAAAARAFVRDAELVLFDDLSSALDVETERELWDRLFRERKATYLLVSHRRSALRWADNIVLLKDGHVEAEGPLDYLMMRNEEIRQLWGRTE